MRGFAGDFARFDLRFVDRETEVSYKASVEAEVLRFGTLAAFCGLLMILITLVPVYIEEANNSHNPYDLGVWDVRTLMLVLWLSTFLFTGLFTMFGCLRIWRDWFKQWNWEGLFVCMATYYAVSLALANFWHLPLLFGSHPTDIWAHDARGAEVYILLALDGIITVVTMYIPVRSCALWILPLCGIGSYMMMLVVVDSVFPADRFKSVSALVGLTVLSCHGAYRNEQNRRDKFIAERQVIEATEEVNRKENEIQETAALVRGLKTVANALCDIIVKLTEDLRVCGSESHLDSFFEQHMEGRLFAEALTESDRARFHALVSGVSGSQVHACMPVTLRKTSGMSEAHLLLVDTGRSMPRYFLGIRVEMEHLDAQGQDDDNNPTKVGGNYMGVVPAPPLVPPPNHMNQPLEPDKDSDFSFTTYPKTSAEVATLAYTSVRARAISLKKVMPRWNIPRDTGSCCQFHTVVDSIHEVADFLGEKPCEPLWSTLSGGQCVRCKSMCTQTRTKCVVCGYAQR